MAHGPSLSHCLFLQVEFYLDPAACSLLCVVYGCFAQQWEVSIVTANLKIFAIWPFIETVYQLLL